MNRHRLKKQTAGVTLKLIAFFAQSSFLLRLRRILMRFIPFLQLQSQVKNIVYLSWLVDIEKVRSRYPSHVQLWEKQGKTIFSILTYQHQHFGFSFLGRLRQLMPSPRQSNWRFYITPEQQDKTVIFEQVMIDQKLYVLSGRLTSDAMPAQYALQFVHERQDDIIQTQIELDALYRLSSAVKIKTDQQLPQAWQPLFPSWKDAIAYLVDQDHAWVQWVDQPERLSQGDIEMPFDFNQIQAAQVLNIDCPLLQQWEVQEQDVFAFVVPALNFYVKNETPLD